MRIGRNSWALEARNGDFLISIMAVGAGRMERFLPVSGGIGLCLSCLRDLYYSVYIELKLMKSKPLFSSLLVTLLPPRLYGVLPRMNLESRSTLEPAQNGQVT